MWHRLVSNLPYSSVWTGTPPAPSCLSLSSAWMKGVCLHGCLLCYCFENEAFPLPPWLFPYLLKILEELISFLFMLFINILPLTLTRTQDVSFIFVFTYFFKTEYYYIAQSALELENLPSSGVVGMHYHSIYASSFTETEFCLNNPGASLFAWNILNLFKIGKLY